MVREEVMALARAFSRRTETSLEEGRGKLAPAIMLLA
jgi:hypothetical protein